MVLPKKVWLRIDVDHACFNKYLSYIRLTTGLPIPNFLNHVKETKRFLSHYEIERIWFFRPRTCPNDWDEPFGLHATYAEPKKFKKELQTIERKLGKVRYFTRHGYARFASGRLWKKEEINRIEKMFNIIDLSDIPHFTIGRSDPSTIEWIGRDYEYILFHPIHIKIYRNLIEEVLQYVLKT